MPAKSPSPEAAQNKLRKAEIRDLEKTRRQLLTRVDPLLKEAEHQLTLALRAEAKAVKRGRTAGEKYFRLKAKLQKSKTRDLDQLDRRIAILKGRVGIQ